MKHISKRLLSYLPNSLNDNQIKIEYLCLSIRAYNCLRRNGVETISELITKMVESDIKEFRNLGSKTEKEIEEKILKFLDNYQHKINDKEITKQTSHEQVAELIPNTEIQQKNWEFENLQKLNIKDEQFSLNQVETLFVNFEISERNWEIIKLRSIGNTLQGISEIFGLSRERIRQIIEWETRKINNRIYHLIGFFDFIERRLSCKLKIIESDLDFGISVKTFIELLKPTIGYELSESLCIKTIIVLRFLSFSKNKICIKNRQGISYFACSINPIIIAHQKVKKQYIDREKEGEKFTYSQLAYEVLSKSGQPLHWRVIAEKAENFGKRKSFNASVLYNSIQSHKELFVLVNQGTYGLKEWGLNKIEHFPEIIANILKIEKTPLPFGKLLFEVKRIRQIKKSSLIMFLDLHPRFYKSNNNTYGLRAWLKERYKQNLLTPADFIEESKSYQRVSNAKSRGYNIKKIILRDK
jgi:hypothetical protein